MSIKSFGERIADVLIEDGLLLPAQLAEAMDLQKKQGGRLLKLLTDKQYVTEQDMVISMGRCLDTPPINLSKVRVPEEVQDLVPKEMARAYKLAPVCRLGNKLFVAMADPLNVLALDDLRQRTKLEIVPMITTERAVTEALSGVGSASAHDGPGAEGRRAGSADVEEVKAEARGDRSRSAGGGKRGRAGRQDRQPDPRPGAQGKGVGHSHRAFRESSSSSATAWTAP